MRNWPRRIQSALHDGPCVVVTLNRIAGSAPRESGCRMIVTQSTFSGSIGGGNLEHSAIIRARALLEESDAPRQEHDAYGLGPDLNQCCGGAVRLLFEVLSGDCPGWVRAAAKAWDDGEAVVLAQAIDGGQPLRSVLRERGTGEPPVPAAVREAARALLAAGNTTPQGDAPQGPDGLPSVEHEEITWWLEPLGAPLWPVWLFGAGHVGREVARLLERLPFKVRWIDSRPEAFPPETSGLVQAVTSDAPPAEVDRAQPGSVFIVMTHSHQLDEDICHAILQRGDFAWLGLIGSAAKRKRFVHRLAKRGVAKDRLRHLVCPVGLPGVDGKQPATIALSLACQLMMEKPWIRADN